MKKILPVLFQDVDDVSAKLAPVWLAHYNKDWGDSLTEADITDWNIHNFVRPECGLHIYDYLRDPALYDEVTPTPGAVEGTKELRETGLIRILFATSCPIEVAGRKFFWLRDWGFIQKERDYIEIRDKSLLRGKYMADDNYDNINGFTGYGYLFDAPWNRKFKTGRRVMGWEDFVIKMKRNLTRRGI